MTKIVSIAATFALLLVSADASETAKQRRSKDGKDFDTFVLSQLWPQTSCLNLNDDWQSLGQSCSRCRMPNQWTIHGLWPSNRSPGKDSPSFCRSDAKLRPNSLSASLKERLLDQWTTFKWNMKKEAFWSYEYRKHGSCALQHESINTPEKYFGKALELLQRHNVGRALQSRGISPNAAYGFFEVYDAIKNSLGVNVVVNCARNKLNTKEQYLSEVHVCYDKSFQLVDCAADNGHISNCKRNNKLLYPRTMKTC